MLDQAAHELDTGAEKQLANFSYGDERIWMIFKEFVENSSFWGLSVCFCNWSVQINVTMFLGVVLQGYVSFPQLLSDSDSAIESNGIVEIYYNRG